MTERSPTTWKAGRRPGGRPSGRRAAWWALAALVWAAAPAAAQSAVVWEPMPLLPDRSSQDAYAVDWLMGDGSADPAADTLVMFHNDGVFRYAPGEANGEWGDWRKICPAGCGTADGVVTTEGSIVYARPGSVTRRSADRGQTWADAYEFGAFTLREVTLPWMRAAAAGRAVLLSATAYVDGRQAVSYADGEAGSWTTGGPASAFLDALGEVPPSPALPLGRLLSGGEQVMYSDDGAATWQTAALGGQPQQSYLSFEFAFLPVAGHPYGGAAFALGCGEYVFCDSAGGGTGETAQLWRSDDGGASWAFTHQFTAAETGIAVTNGIGPELGVPFAGPDGALWAGVSRANGGTPNPGRILRSTDGGVTWARADAGLASANGGRGYRIRQLALARDGRLYAATDGGVWRTTQPVPVAGETGPPSSALGLVVRPNPSSGVVVVAVSSSVVADVTVEVFDALGRRVAAVYTGPLAAGERAFMVETAGWPAGAYTVRVSSGGRTATAGLTVAR